MTNTNYCLKCGATGPCEHTLKTVPTREEILGNSPKVEETKADQEARFVLSNFEDYWQLRANDESMVVARNAYTAGFVLGLKKAREIFCGDNGLLKETD